MFPPTHRPGLTAGALPRLSRPNGPWQSGKAQLICIVFYRSGPRRSGKIRIRTSLRKLSPAQPRSSNKARRDNCLSDPALQDRPRRAVFHACVLGISKRSGRSTPYYLGVDYLSAREVPRPAWATPPGSPSLTWGTTNALQYAHSRIHIIPFLVEREKKTRRRLIPSQLVISSDTAFQKDPGLVGTICGTSLFGH